MRSDRDSFLVPLTAPGLHGIRPDLAEAASFNSAAGEYPVLCVVTVSEAVDKVGLRYSEEIPLGSPAVRWHAKTPPVAPRAILCAPNPRREKFVDTIALIRAIREERK